jgi:hypothetical protein
MTAPYIDLEKLWDQKYRDGGSQYLIPGTFGGGAYSTFDAQFGYGAKGDGVSDDTAALTAWANAINSAAFGAIGVLPPGQYIVKTPLPTITKAGTKLVGAGHSQTTFTVGSCISAGSGYAAGGNPMLTFAAEGCELNGIMIDGQGSAPSLIAVTGANCRLINFGCHGVAAGSGGVPNVCVDIRSGGVSCWVTGAWRVNGINMPNTGIQIADTDVIVEGGKPTNNTYNIVLLAGSDGTQIQDCHMTPGSLGASCVWFNGSTSHIQVNGNRFDNYVQSAVQISPTASTPNTIAITNNTFHGAVMTDNTYALVALDTTLSGCRGLQVNNNIGYASASHVPASFLSAQTQAGSAATNTSRLASLGTQANGNTAWVTAAGFWGSGLPTVSRGNLATANGTTYAAVTDI